MVISVNQQRRRVLFRMQLASVLSNGLTYTVHLRLHDVRQFKEGSLPVFRVVEMWCQHVLGDPYVDKDIETLLVFDSFYHCNAARVYLNEHKVKYIGTSNPNWFTVQCDRLRRKVRKFGNYAGILNKSTDEIIM